METTPHTREEQEAGAPRVLVRRGLVFDGSGSDGVVADVVISNGVVEQISTAPLPLEGYDQVINATGRWVTPGFLEIHSHYDAEIIASPGLLESVRHGVTSVVVGSCSLS